MKKKLMISIVVIAIIASTMILWVGEKESSNSKDIFNIEQLINSIIVINGLGEIKSNDIIDFKYVDDTKDSIQMETTQGSFIFDYKYIVDNYEYELKQVIIDEYELIYGNIIFDLINEKKDEIVNDDNDNQVIEFTYDIYQNIKNAEVVNIFEYKVRFNGKFEGDKEYGNANGTMTIELQNIHGLNWLVTSEEMTKETVKSSH